MDKTEFIQHWNYFCSLAERIDETKHYIDHGLYERNGSLELKHGKVYSDNFKQIIVLSASEFEVMSKTLCRFKGVHAENIVEISRGVLSEFPKIIKTEVSTPFWINYPLEGWKVEEDKVLGLEWWRAYTSIKHGNKDSMQCATLKNSILALEALYVLDLYLMYQIFGDLSIAYSYPTVYFRSKYTAYSVSYGEGRLPDYGDLSATDMIKVKFPGFFNEGDK